MFSQLIEAAKEPTVNALGNIVIQNQEKLVSYSQNYLSQMNIIMHQMDNEKILMRNYTLTQQSINQLYNQVSQIQDFEQLDLLNLSKKSLSSLRKQQNKKNKINKEQKQLYREAITQVKKMKTAIRDLNAASNNILKQYYNNKEKNKVDEYMQKAIALSENYQSLILKELNENYSSKTVFQIEGQVFAVVNIDIAAKYLIESDISAESKGEKIKGRFKIPKFLKDIDVKTLKEQYGLIRLDNLVANNPIAYSIMQTFLSAKKDEEGPINVINSFGQYTISRGDRGKYIVDWTYKGKQYQGIIGNEGDLSEIYLAALFNQQDLSGNALGKFITATKVDNISGALVGDFRKEIEKKFFEFSAKSNKASYTLINQMQTLAYQIIGLNTAGIGNIREIIGAEYSKQAEASSTSNGRNIVIDVIKKKIINLFE